VACVDDEFLVRLQRLRISRWILTRFISLTMRYLMCAHTSGSLRLLLCDLVTIWLKGVHQKVFGTIIAAVHVVLEDPFAIFPTLRSGLGPSSKLADMLGQLAHP
jgi:hypothetical protein